MSAIPADSKPTTDVRGRRPTFLGGARAVFSRELSGWFDAPIAWLALAVALFAASSWFLNEFFLANQLDLRPFFDRLPWLYVLLVPALAMRTWSEDLRSRAFELWMTLPLSPAQVVLGKYAAATSVLLLFLAGTLPLAVFLFVLGEPDLGRIVAGYVGALLLGAQLLAVGQLASAFFAEGLLAFLVAALAGAVLLATGEERVVAVLDGLAPELLPGRALASSVSSLPPYESFISGRLGLGPLLHFTATIGACLWANVLVAARVRT